MRARMILRAQRADTTGSRPLKRDVRRLGTSLNAYLVALTYAVVSAVVIPLGFAVFNTHYRYVDVILGAVAGAALSFIPTLGGVASLVGTVGVLYWRIGRDLFPDIVISVLVARLAMLPVLLPLLRK